MSRRVRAGLGRPAMSAALCGLVGAVLLAAWGLARARGNTSFEAVGLAGDVLLAGQAALAAVAVRFRPAAAVRPVWVWVAVGGAVVLAGSQALRLTGVVGLGVQAPVAFGAIAALAAGWGAAAPSSDWPARAAAVAGVAGAAVFALAGGQELVESGRRLREEPAVAAALGLLLIAWLALFALSLARFDRPSTKDAGDLADREA